MAAEVSTENFKKINKVIKIDEDGEMEEYEEMSREQKDFIIDKNTKIIMKHVRKFNYLVMDVDKNIKLYKSLREIEKELNISFSGISKKLKLSNYCLCTPKKTADVYYIHNLAE